MIENSRTGGQILVDRDFRREDFQQLATRHRVNVLADQQQQPVAAIEIAAVETDVGTGDALGKRMCLGRLHVGVSLLP